MSGHQFITWAVIASGTCAFVFLAWKTLRRTRSSLPVVSSPYAMHWILGLPCYWQIIATEADLPARGHDGDRFFACEERSCWAWWDDQWVRTILPSPPPRREDSRGIPHYRNGYTNGWLPRIGP